MIEERAGMTAETRAAAGGPGDEAFRLLRSTLKFAAGDRPVRSVLVVDIDRPETSGVARRLAESFARAGDRCALVETDGRAGGDAAGFADLIRGAPLAAAIADAEHGGPVVVPAGRGAAADALSSDGVGEALRTLLQSYEYVILSCAPLPRYADALALAPRVDAVIMVASSGKTRRPKAIDARDALERVGANILGVVLAEETRGWFR